MSPKKHVRRQQNKMLYVSLISMAHTCVIQFFPLYLKHLNLAAFEVGLIRACQVWLSVLMLPVWLSLAKRLRSKCWKRIVFCVFLFLIINIHFCLTFLPLSNKLQDVTHCHTNENLLPRKAITNTAHSIQGNYTLPNIQVSSNLHERLNHSIPDVSSEVNKPTTNVTNMNAQGFIGRDTSNSKYSHESKNISSQNFVNNLLETDPKVSLFPQVINRTNFNFSSYGDIGTVLNLKPYNSSKKTYSNKVNYSSSGNMKGLVSKLKEHNVSSVAEVQNFITKLKKTNHSNVHQKKNSIHDIFNITKLFSEESSMILGTVSTESSYDFEINKNSTGNLNFNYSKFPISNRSLAHQITQNNNKRVKNTFNSSINYIDKKFPISPSRDNILDTTAKKTKNLAVDNSNSRLEYVSKRNKAKFDMSYHPHHQNQVIHPWRSHHYGSVHHNTNGDSVNRISSYATKTRLEKSDSEFQPSDRLKESVNIDSYGTLDSNVKSSMKNQNVQIVNAQYKEEEEGNKSAEENEETNDWQILNTSLQTQRQKRNVERKKHHMMKRHYHHAYSRKFHHKSDKSNKSHDKKFNSFYQYSLSGNIHEKSLEKGRTINPRTTRRLMFIDESEEQNDRTDSEVKKTHITLVNQDKISKEFLNIIINNKIKNILSLTFGTILLLAILVEIFSSAIMTTSNQILISDDKTRCSVHQHIIGYRREDSQQIWTLITWGIFGCPTIALLVLFTECSYQPRAFIIFSTVLIGMALLLVLFFIQLPDADWEWKLKDCREEIVQRSTPFLKRFGCSISIFVAGFAMACNSEFTLWYMDTLSGFPYNYQLLYCGYIGIGAMFQALVKSWLLRKQMSSSLQMQDFRNSDVDTTGGDGVKSIGPILLGLHFLAASMLQPAWSLLFLGILQGCSAAFLISTRISVCWTAGYGLGCVTGGFVVNLHSADRLFWIMAGSMFVWSAMGTLSRGLLKCTGNNDRDKATYSQLLLLDEDSDKEEMMVEEVEEEEDEKDECNDDDWLERALKKDEQQEAQRLRIMSCPI